MPAAIDMTPMIIFSAVMSFLSCPGVMPCMSRMPNSLFLDFKKALTEYRTNKKEKTKIIHSAAVKPFLAILFR